MNDALTTQSMMMATGYNSTAASPRKVGRAQDSLKRTFFEGMGTTYGRDLTMQRLPLLEPVAVTDGRAMDQARVTDLSNALSAKHGFGLGQGR